MNTERRFRLGFSALCLFLAASSAGATLISYEASNIAGSRWRYDYVVHSEPLNIPVQEFSIFFDDRYANLAVVSSPADWDSLVVQPDPALPDVGFFDSLSLTALSAGESIGGFGVAFDWLGAGTPGAQLWNVIDPATFITLEAGQTRVVPPTTVPEPSSLLLFAIATAFAGLPSRRR